MAGVHGNTHAHSRGPAQPGAAAARQVAAGDPAGGGSGSRSRSRQSVEPSVSSGNSGSPRLTEALLAELEAQQKLQARKEKAADGHGEALTFPRPGVFIALHTALLMMPCSFQDALNLKQLIQRSGDATCERPGMQVLGILAEFLQIGKVTAVGLMRRTDMGVAGCSGAVCGHGESCKEGGKRQREEPDRV